MSLNKIAFEQNTDELMARVDEQSRQIAEEIRKSRKVRKYMIELLDEITEDNQELLTEIELVNAGINQLMVKLGAPPTSASASERFAVYHKPGTQHYRMIKCQEISYKSSSKRYIDRGYTKCVYDSESPNAVNLRHRLKRIMPDTLGDVTGSSVVLVAGKTTQDLVNYIMAAESEKKNI